MTAEGPVPAAVNEAALTICAILDTTEVPMEVARGRMVRMRRWLRERITHGVRYPRFDSVFRDTYWDRLRLWGEAAARHPGGVKALNHAGFLPGYSDTDRARKFADRLVAYTQRLLLDHGLPEQQNRVRDEMASEVFRGIPRSELSNRERYRQITVRSLTYGIGSSLFTLLAFGQDLDNSAILGGVAATSAAITDISHGGLGRLSGPMLAARRQARDWLASTLPLWLLAHVTWAEGATPPKPGRAIDCLAHVLTALTAGEAKLKGPHEGEQVVRHLKHLIESADRVGDAALHTALMNVEGAIVFSPDNIARSLSALHSLVAGVPDLSGPS